VSQKTERRLIIQHASTILVGQLAVMAFGITDTLVAGRFDQKALAALSVGSAVFISVFVALMGILQALLPVLSEMHGAKKPLEVGRQFRQGLYLLLISSALGIAILLNPHLILQWTKVPKGLEHEVSDYLVVQCLGLPLALLFRMFSTLNQSIGKPKLVTWIQIIGLLLKIPLSIALTFGVWHSNALGLMGCAWATFLVYLAMVTLCIGLLRKQALYKPFEIWRALEKPHWSSLKNLLRIGLPNALSVAVEVTSFTLMALFIARQGTTAAATHQIVTSLAALLYMAPLSLSIATSARVSYWLGAEDPLKARMVMKQGFLIDWSLAAMVSVAIFFLNPWIAPLFSSNPEVVSAASGVLIWLSLYHLGDATQVMCFFMLRCYKITIMPLVLYCVFLWGVGLMGGYHLAYEGLEKLNWPAMPSPKTFWLSNTAAVFMVSICMLTLLNWVSRRSIPRRSSH